MTKSGLRRITQRMVPLLALFSAAVLAGCSSSASGAPSASTGSASAAGASLPGTTAYADQKPITPVTTISIAYSAQSADDLYLFAAIDDGAFTREGLDVKTQLIQSAPSLSALISGQVAFTLVGGGDTLSAVAGGASTLRWIGTSDTYAAYLFYTRPGITSASQLNGATIASTSAAGTSTVCSKLAMSKLGITNYKIAYLGSVTSDASALLSGAAQGICINPPASYKLDAAGDNDLWNLTANKVKLAQNGVATTEGEIQGNPGVVQRFMTALTEGEKIVHEQGSAQVAADEKLLEQVTDGTVTAAVAAKTMAYEWTVQSGNLTPVDADLQLSQKYEALVNPAIAKVDLGTVIVPSFAEAAATAVYGSDPPSNG